MTVHIHREVTDRHNRHSQHFYGRNEHRMSVFGMSQASDVCKLESL